MGSVSASYKKWIERLLSKKQREVRFSSLDSLRFWIEKLDVPLKNYQSIHVAGTNGKGSVCCKISHGLQKLGFRVGLFSSPHLISFCERIQINKENISEEKAAKLAETLLERVGQEAMDTFSFFEEIFFVALLYFAEQKVDYVVWEAGLGGRLDTTNVIIPVLSIITSIGWDHMDILGDSLEKIAFEKAGIIKEKVPVVLGPTAKERCEEKAKEKKAPCYPVFGSFSFFDEENQEIAKKAFSVLFEKIDSSFFVEALEKRPPGRWEQKEKEGKTIFLDGAHNLSGFMSLQKLLQKEFPQKKLGIVASFCKKKEAKASLESISVFIEKAYLAPFSNSRSLSFKELKKELDKASFAKEFFSGIKEAFEEALKNHEVILITGSFLLMEEVYPLFSQSKEG